jgi:hypothetical protein
MTETKAKMRRADHRSTEEYTLWPWRRGRREGSGGSGRNRAEAAVRREPISGFG